MKHETEPVLSDEERSILRGHAVTRVDERHGYTCEFAPNQRQHMIEYDEEEARLVAQALGSRK